MTREEYLKINDALTTLSHYAHEYGWELPEGRGDLRAYEMAINPHFWIAVHEMFLAQLTESVEPGTPPGVEKDRELPKDKRVVRTKSTGDRVYLIDETAKTKAWVTSPEILTKLGFELSDVQDVEDSEMLGYAMTASVYRVED